MNKEMIDNMLETVTDMSDEVEDLQTSGYDLDEFVTDIEMRLRDAGLGLSGLQHDIRKLDQNATKAVGKLAGKKKGEATEPQRDSLPW